MKKQFVCLPESRELGSTTMAGGARILWDERVKEVPETVAAGLIADGFYPCWTPADALAHYELDELPDMDALPPILDVFQPNAETEKLVVMTPLSRAALRAAMKLAGKLGRVKRARFESRAAEEAARKAAEEAKSKPAARTKTTKKGGAK